MKVIVTGAKGQLGYDVVKCLMERGHEAVGMDKDEADITSFQEVEACFKKAGAEAVIHCAAYTAVDAAEDEEETADQVNRIGTENISKICAALHMKMLYISTDYVFDGTGQKPWKPEDGRRPENAYGRTKLGGELAVEKYLKDFFIVRISWVFGINGKNFVKTMLRLGREHSRVRVVDDQIGSPAYTKDIAPLLVDMIESEKYGIYHAANEGYISWYEFAREIFQTAGMDFVEVIPVDSGAYVTKAVRPKNSRMDQEKLAGEGFTPLRNWKEALADYIAEMEKAEKEEKAERNPG